MKINILTIPQIWEIRDKRKAEERRVELYALIGPLHKAIVEDGDLAAAKPLIERAKVLVLEDEKAKNVPHSSLWYSRHRECNILNRKGETL